MRAGLKPFLPKHRTGCGHQRDQEEVDEQQFVLQNETPPFFSGISFRDTTPLTVSRTGIIFSFGCALPRRISDVAMSSFCAVRAASRLTSCSIRQSKETLTDTSP